MRGVVSVFRIYVAPVSMRNLQAGRGNYRQLHHQVAIFWLCFQPITIIIMARAVFLVAALASIVASAPSTLGKDDLGLAEEPEIALDDIENSPCFGAPESDEDKDALYIDLPDISDLPWPSYEELFGPDDEDENDLLPFEDESVCFNNSTSSAKPGLHKRQHWTSPNEIQFYMRRNPSSCDRSKQGCVNDWVNKIVVRDSCYSDVCSSGIQRLNSWDIGHMCHKEFRACHVAGGNWRLIIRDINRAGLNRDANCARAAELFSYTASCSWRHRPYGTLVDAANGREVGWCYVQDNHSYTKACGITSAIMRSLVRCGWFGHGIWWPFRN